MNKFGNFTAVLDSGVGGLTILDWLQNKFPQENFLYIADSAHCPYGVKSNEEIFSRLKAIAHWLVCRDVSAIVLACNTASVFADKLRRQISIPLFDVIVPTCRLAARITQTKRVALLATDATVRSGAYVRQLAEFGVFVRSFNCSSLVPYAEKGLGGTPSCDAEAERLLKQLPSADADVVILGCTHFPLLKESILPHIGKAKAVQCVTDFVPVSPQSAQKCGKRIFLTTGVVRQKSVPPVFGETHFVHVDI